MMFVLDEDVDFNGVMKLYEMTVRDEYELM